MMIFALAGPQSDGLTRGQWSAQSDQGLISFPKTSSEIALGLSLKGFTFAVDQNRLITWYTDGRAYVLDLAWLQAVGGDDADLSPKEILQLACQEPFVSRPFDESALADYVDGERPKACVER